LGSLDIDMLSRQGSYSEPLRGPSRVPSPVMVPPLVLLPDPHRTSSRGPPSPSRSPRSPDTNPDTNPGPIFTMPVYDPNNPQMIPLPHYNFFQYNPHAGLLRRKMTNKLAPKRRQESRRRRRPRRTRRRVL
jgi:hypothetical protein